MNLTDIKINLFNYFSTHDELIWPDDKLKIITISETPELHYAAVLAALESFEAGGYVKKLEYREGKIQKLAFILEKPLKNYSQTITLSGELCAYVANLINNLHNLNKIPGQNDENVSNALAISELEISALVSVVENFIKQKAAEIKS